MTGRTGAVGGRGAMDVSQGQVAYFSMEIALDTSVPTYSGGLGVLAGDTIRAAADLGLPMIAVSLAHRRGYFRQHLDGEGNQKQEHAPWNPEDRLEALEPVVEIRVAGRKVAIRGWMWRVTGASGSEVPVILLDTSLERNDPEARGFTDELYGGDERYRLAQEAVLGIGGVALLRALDCRQVRTWHMNEGHSSLLVLALLEEQLAVDGRDLPDDRALETVRQQCVFTTHTPVPAGHDRFPMELVRSVLGEDRARLVAATGCCMGETLNMTNMALHSSRFVNGVAMRHRAVSTEMFPGYPINSITNGVHATTWTSRPFQALFDRHVPEWRRQNLNLRYTIGIPVDQVQEAHEQAKRELLAQLDRRFGVQLAPERFTIGFGRRATAYKRASLLFTDLERLRRIVREVGPIQVVFAGKAHPRDEVGKEQIRAVFRASAELGDELPVVYVENYEMELALHLCAGSDLWLNTPRKPQEASGTSGMKAALNGVPSLSVLDGWWVEGHVEGVTGWSVDGGESDSGDDRAEADSLYHKLETAILPLYFERPDGYGAVRRSAIALNGSFFNAERMAFQYAENAYRL